MATGLIVPDEFECAIPLLEEYFASISAANARLPDFNKAYNFLMAKIEAELIAGGYVEQVERSGAMNVYEGLLVGRAMYNGEDPGQKIYDYALSCGYVSSCGCASKAPRGLKELWASDGLPSFDAAEGAQESINNKGKPECLES